jgi:hypothetical protein
LGFIGGLSPRPLLGEGALGVLEDLEILEGLEGLEGLGVLGLLEFPRAS